jgi:acetyl esterase/lipase
MSKMLLGFLSVVLVAASAAAQTEVPFGPIPSTISDEAKEALAKAKPYPKEFTKLYRNKTEWQEWRQKWDQAWREGSEELVRRYGVSVEILHIAGIPVRLITPKDFDQANSNCAILEIHGGGFVIGSPDAAYGDGVPIAARTNCRVFAIGYRLAPEHPFPSALDDCHKVYQAIVRDYSVKKIAVTGASAGGNLALALTLKLRSEDSKLPIPTCLAVV